MSTEAHPFYAKRARQARGLQRLALRIVPFHQYVGLRAELHIFRIRLGARRVRARYKFSRDLLVNVGAGAQGQPGWVNVDMWPGTHVNCLYDCRASLPFATGAVRGIFAEHFLEHLDYTEEVPRFIAECARVLAPGGVLRVVVPDAGAYLRAYSDESWSALATLRGLGADREDPWLGGRYRTRMELVNTIFRQGHEHKYAYDFDTLALVLRGGGFDRVHRVAFGVTHMPGLALDRADRAAESLYAEAIKKETPPVR